MIVYLLSLYHQTKQNRGMKRYKTKEIIRMLEKDGWICIAQRGSHRQYKHSTKSGKVTINGQLNDTLTQFILNSIFKQAGWRK